MTGPVETFEEFLARLHCSQVDFEQLASWYFDERAENTILRESILKARGAGYNEDCIFCGTKDRIMDEALAKVRGDE